MRRTPAVATLALAIAVLSACSNDAAEDQPTRAASSPSAGTSAPSAPPESPGNPFDSFPVGASGKYTATMHCNLRNVMIDGAIWQAGPAPSDAVAYRGPGLGMVLKPDGRNRIRGTLTRPEVDRAVLSVDRAYRLNAPVRITFTPAPAGTGGCA